MVLMGRIQVEVSNIDTFRMKKQACIGILTGFAATLRTLATFQSHQPPDTRHRKWQIAQHIHRKRHAPTRALVGKRMVVRVLGNGRAEAGHQQPNGQSQQQCGFRTGH